VPRELCGECGLNLAVQAREDPFGSTDAEVEELVRSLPPPPLPLPEPGAGR
jgi:hypothetical protein